MRRDVGVVTRIVAVWLAGMAAQVARGGTDVQTGLGGNEPTTAAVNPLSPNVVAVARGLTVALSTDFGQTFPITANMPQAAPNPPLYGTIATWNFCGDASLAFDSQGRLFMSYLLCGNDSGGTRVDISGFVQQVNPTTGALIGNPVEVTGANQLHNDDKTWIAADANPGSAFRDSLYVVWTRLDGGGSQVMFSRLTPTAAAWSAPSQLDDGSEGFVWPSHIAVGPTGDVFVTYHTDTCGAVDADMVVLRDSNGGAQLQAGNGTPLPYQKTSFKAAVTCNVQTSSNAIPNTNFWMQGANQGFVIPDPIRPGYVYVVANDDTDDDFSTATGGDGGDVVLARSTDSGQTWTVSTVSHGLPGTFQGFPTGAADQLGNLVVTWWDTRRGLTNGSGSLLLDQYATVSRDAGETFGLDFRVSDFAMDPDLNAPCRFGAACGGSGANTLRIGEYNGTAAADGAGYAIWTANAGQNPPSGNQTTYFDAFSILGAFPDAGEPNDAFDPGVASVLGANGTYTVQDLTIHSDADEDWFKVVALNTGKLTFTIAYNHRFSDLDLEVHDKFENVLGTAATPGVDTNDVETIVVPAVAGEAYFLRVRGEPGQAPNVNTYDLSIVNTAAPVPFGIALAPGSDTGISSTDDLTRLAMPTVLLAVDLVPLAGLAFSPDTGAATLADDAPGYKVELYADGNPVGRASPVAGQPGVFTFTFGTPLSDGPHLVTARVVIVDGSDGPALGTAHAVGQGGASKALLVTIDTTAPDATALGALDLLASSDTGGVDDDDVTTFSTPSFGIQVNAPGFLRVFAQKLPAGANTQVGQVLVTNPDQWQLAVQSMQDGVYLMTATLEDAAGNVGPPTTALKVTIAKTSLVLPGDTAALLGAVTVDLAARTITGYDSASAIPGKPIGIAGIPSVLIDAGANAFTVNLTAGDDALGYTPSGGSSGTVALSGTGQAISFSNAGAFTVNPLAGVDTVTTYGTAAADAVTVTVLPTLAVQLGTTKAMLVPASQVEKVGVSTAQGNDAITVNVYDTASAALFVDGGEPSTVNKGNDQLNLYDRSAGRKGVYSNISGGSTAGSGAVLLSFKATGNATRVDYVAIEKQTRK